MKTYTTHSATRTKFGTSSKGIPLQPAMNMPWWALGVFGLAVGLMGVFWLVPQSFAADGAMPTPNAMKGLAGLYAIIAGVSTLLHKKATRNSLDPEAYSRGITGWLLYFLLAFTGAFVLSLLTDVADTFTEFQGETGESFFWGLLLVVSVQVLFYGFWVATVFALWSKKSTAPRLAKWCLAVLLVYAVAMPGFSVLLFWLPEQTFALADVGWKEVYDQETILRAIQMFFFCLIWFSYLSVSKRVRLTYQAAPVAQPETAE